MEPKFGFHTPIADMHVRGLVTLGGVKKHSVRPPPQNRRHLRHPNFFPPHRRRDGAYNGKLSCFFAGISTFLSLSIASALAIRRLVECGMMTSSI